jgi:hypothetical protein
MPKNGDRWPQWWSVTWTVILGFASIIEFLHLREQWNRGEYKNLVGPLIMGIGLGYMASESCRGEWP